MLDALFEKMVEVSAILAAAGVLYLAFRPLIRKYFGASAEYALLALIMLRGLIPFHNALTLPAAPLPEPASVQTEIIQTEMQTNPGMIEFLGKTPEYPAEEFPLPDFAEPYLPAPEPAVTSGEILSAVAEALPYIWLAGILAVLLANVIRHLRTAKFFKKHTETVCDREISAVFAKIKTELNITNNIELRRGTCIKTPVLCGFSRTVLYLPEKNFTPEQLATIFRHELTHYVRGDLWGKLFFLAGKAVHWFNPLVWIIARMADFNMELACDNAVLKGETKDFRRNYGYMILEVAISGRKQDVLSTKFYGGKRQMKKRFENIAEQRTFHSGRTLLIAGIMVTLGLGLLIGCERAEPEAVLPENTVGTSASFEETTDPETTAPPLFGDISEDDAVDLELIPDAGLEADLYYKDRVFGDSSFSGKITKIDGNKFSVLFEAKDWEQDFEFDSDTIINVPGGLAAGKNVTVVSSASLAKTITEYITLTMNGENIYVSPPTNIAKVVADFSTEEDEYGRTHIGIDLTSSDGEKGFIFSSTSGTVAEAGWDSGYGLKIVISDSLNPGYTYLYAHCSQILIKKGDEVRPGQIIGRIGNTGNSYREHLHYEVRYHGNHIDPAPFIGEIPEKPSERVNSTNVKTLADIQKLRAMSQAFAHDYFNNDLRRVEMHTSAGKAFVTPQTYGGEINISDQKLQIIFNDRKHASCILWYKTEGENTYRYLRLDCYYNGEPWGIRSYGSFKTEFTSIPVLTAFNSDIVNNIFTIAPKERAATNIIPAKFAYDFAEAYFSNDVKGVDDLVGKAMSFNREAYGEDVWDTLENVELKLLINSNDTVACQMRYSLPGEDTYTYLSIEMSYSYPTEEWYVTSYGLDK